MRVTSRNGGGHRTAPHRDPGYARSAGPMFFAPIAVAVAPVAEREGFVFADIRPVSEGEEPR
jgi:hypothetical protein